MVYINQKKTNIFGFILKESKLRPKGYAWIPRAFVLSLQSFLTLSTPWTGAVQAPLSMGFSRQEYWSGLPWPPAGDLLNPGFKPRPPALQVDSLPTKPPGKPLGSIHLLKPWKVHETPPPSYPISHWFSCCPCLLLQELLKIAVMTLSKGI